jgi:hypothetical protein
MNCWHTFLSRSFIFAILFPFLVNLNLVAGAAGEATDARLAPIHDTRTGSVVGYADMQQQEVFNAQQQYVGNWDQDGTYDAQGNQVLDKPMPGILLTSGNAKGANASQTILAMPNGLPLNRVAIQRVPVAVETVGVPVVTAGTVPLIVRSGRGLTEAERAIHAQRRAMMEAKKTERKALAAEHAEKQLAREKLKKEKERIEAEKKEEHKASHAHKGAGKEKHTKLAKA